MARIVGRLKARQVDNIKPKVGEPSIVLGDGGNLYLQATVGTEGNIRRSWLFKYQLDHHRREMGLGPTHTLSLAEARAKARSLRQLLLDGIDPLSVKREQQAKRRLETVKATTFAQCVQAYLQTHDASWSVRHSEAWRMTLTKYCKPIADLPVNAIDTDLVLRVLTPHWKERTETAKRLRGRIERVLAWAKGRGLRDGENPARWAGHLDEMLPKPSKVAPVVHHPAMPYQDVPQFLLELRDRNFLSAQALEFCILTAARSGEVIGATWSEFELEAKVWTIPATRMKAGREHRISLAGRAIELLQARPRKGNGPFALSGMAMLEMLRGMRPGLTVHGFRSTFRTWASEQTNFPREVAEAALAHTIPDAVERAYRRGDLFDKRRKLMDAWSAYCSRPAPTGATITQLRKAPA
jgi:integrase